jgi:hypothetical protein
MRYSPGLNAPPNPIPITARVRISSYSFFIPLEVERKWREREV